ncbi:YveK family protein [Lysinibacillus antri]|uniref:Capsular biosynthesis protein n=1 Tax=Lysinibacillus antri TaxID=2498145 RepID=A0A3S0P7D9_9BACI|nr:Wzz/FepE/Etk N-terminal domain-containing protein [Lysinibacillus antri]RUL55165.1 capsular biosynthesis protein [Lysinibacillus antri]
MEESISLLNILKIIRKWMLLIISLVFVCSGISAIISYYVLPPIYEAETQILVNQKTNGQEYAWSQLETDLQLIDTYNVIIKSPVILNKVINKLNLKTTPESLSGQIYVLNEDNSKVVNIRVEDESPLQSVEIANMVAEVFKEEIPTLMNVDNISILSVAKLSENPSPVKPNKLLNVAIAAVIGLMLGIGLAFLFAFLDTTIKTEQDIEEILALPIMGIVSSISEKDLEVSLPSRTTRGN